LVGWRAWDASSQSIPVNSESASIWARTDQAQGAAINTGRNMTQIARAPAPREREAAAAMENAATTDAAVRIETSAWPPSE
jgi:hypothetical protein